MFPLGHFAIGYFTGLIIQRYTKEDFNIFLIWLISLSPDIDFLIPFVEHRGPTHSILFAISIFIPIFVKYRRGLPYFGALASHSLIGDYFTDYGCKILWPLNDNWIKVSNPFLLVGGKKIVTEFLLFSIMLLVIYIHSRATKT